MPSDALERGLPASWVLRPLGELVVEGGLKTGPFGTQLHATDYVKSGVPILMPKHIGVGALREVPTEQASQEDAERLAVHRLQQDDVVVGRKGELGRRLLVTDREEGWLCGSDSIRVRVNVEMMIPRFVAFYFGHPMVSDWLHRFSTGATMPNLNTTVLARLPVVVPPLNEQGAIAAVLGALDDKVVLNRRTAATAASAAATLFDVLLSENKEAMGTLPDVATLSNGVSYRSADLRDDGSAALVTLKSIGREGDYREEGLKPFDGPHKPDQMLTPGDVVVAKTDLTQRAEVLGRAVRVPGHPDFERLVASLDLVVVRPSVPSVSREFLYALLARRDFREHARSYANGTTVLHLSKQAFADYTFPLPSEENIRRFTEAVVPLLALGDHLAVEARTLSAMRDLLLPKLVSGEVRVRDAEALVEAAT